MAEITEKCKQVIKDLEENISNPKDLEYAKSKVYTLLEEFLNLIEDIQETAGKRVDMLIQSQAELNKRLENLEKDIFEEDDNEFELDCPYCNHNFNIDCDDLKGEVTCPECNNTIELDWNDEAEVSGCCGGACGRNCKNQNLDIDYDDYDDDDEDDM